jgi:copper(I)-binding protein
VNRALRATTMGVLLLSPLALSACSAGQVTQTATQDRDKVGAMASIGDITLRQANLEYPDGGAYEAGDDAELKIAIVNTAAEADTLVDISGEGFDEAEIDTSNAAGPSTEIQSTTAPATGPASRPPAPSELEIPGDSTIFIGGEGTSAITLAGLDEPLTTGRYVTLTLTFENAGEVTLDVPVGTPARELERGEAFDFHHEEQGEESATELGGEGASSE